MYMRFAYSQPGSDEDISALNKSMDSLIKITHEHINPSSAEKRRILLKMPPSKNLLKKALLKKGSAVSKGLCPLPELCRRILIIKKSWKRQEMKNMLVLFDTNMFRMTYLKFLTIPQSILQHPVSFSESPILFFPYK